MFRFFFKKSYGKREPGRYGEILNDHRQDGSVAFSRIVEGIICNLARWGPSVASEIQNQTKISKKKLGVL